MCQLSNNQDITTKSNCLAIKNKGLNSQILMQCIHLYLENFPEILISKFIYTYIIHTHLNPGRKSELDMRVALHQDRLMIKDKNTEK